MALTDLHAPGATAYTEEDLEGFVPDFEPTHEEINALEARNILDGQQWALRSSLSRVPGMLSDEYAKRLHKRMYGEVWRWAGQQRQRVTNIGVQPYQIPVEVRMLFDNVRYWIEQKTFPADELAIRLHHRLIFIHPFRNGNGRHGRMMADILLVRHFRAPRLPWGGELLGRDDPRREEYIAAMRAADKGQYHALLRFCRSE
jgi:Fic-DOC domain mobile mystery protein B